MINIQKKREQESEIIRMMISIYCHGHHNCDTSNLCSDCEELLKYADERITKCPFMESKTFCSSCKIHCYNPQMREKIRSVMRYSGPRIFFHYPIKAIFHAIETMKYKRRR